MIASIEIGRVNPSIDLARALTGVFQGETIESLLSYESVDDPITLADSKPLEVPA